MNPRITQAQADDAAAEAARSWPEFARRWPWTQTPHIAPVYRLVGEQTVGLLRAFPAIQWSNQALWYRRVVRDTPAIIALTPDALREEAQRLAPGADSHALDGKTALSLIYLPESDSAPTTQTGGEPTVAKTLLASTATAAPLYLAQLAHELLNCFCHTEWDGQALRSGVRRSHNLAGQQGGQSVAPAPERGAALNDLLLDAILVHYLPAVTTVRLEDLLDGAQGPYWRIAQTLSARLRGVPTLPALFSGAPLDPDALSRFEQGALLALDTTDTLGKLDRLAAAHDWAGLRALLGAE